MSARIKPKAEQRCHPNCWHEILLAMNSKNERVIIAGTTIEEVLDCHFRLTDDPHRAAALKLKIEVQGRKYVTVHRERLFAFVQEHGRICK